MYHVTFRRSMIHFWKQILSPLLLSVIVFIALYTITPTIKAIPQLISLFIKGISFVIIGIIYILVTKEYNLIKLLKFKK